MADSDFVNYYKLLQISPNAELVASSETEDIQNSDFRKGMSNRRMETSETITIEVVANGGAQSVPASISLDRLLEWLKVDASRVAVELNGQIARKPELPVAAVHEGARIEGVWFVGGGAN